MEWEDKIRWIKRQKCTKCGGGFKDYDGEVCMIDPNLFYCRECGEEYVYDDIENTFKRIRSD